MFSSEGKTRRPRRKQIALAILCAFAAGSPAAETFAADRVDTANNLSGFLNALIQMSKTHPQPATNGAQPVRGRVIPEADSVPTAPVSDVPVAPPVQNPIVSAPTNTFPMAEQPPAPVTQTQPAWSEPATAPAVQQPTPKPQPVQQPNPAPAPAPEPVQQPKQTNTNGGGSP